MFVPKIFVRALSGLKRGMSLPKDLRPRKMVNGSWRSYWPVMLGSSLAIVLVAAGLTAAVHTMKRPAARAVIDVPPDDMPIIEIKIKRGIAKPEPPPLAMSLKAPLPGQIPSPKFQELASILVPPAPEIEMDTNPQDTTCDTYGTSVNFMRSPIAASRKAAKEDKLLFTLHVSGNFEDPQFT